MISLFITYCCSQLNSCRTVFTFSKASSSKKSNLLGKRKPEDGLETKPILKKHKEKSEEKEKETNFDQANSISVKETVEGLDETPDFAEEAKKTLFDGHLSPQTKISDIIDFFKDVGEVVRVRLTVTRWCIHTCCFIEFASANEAKKAMQKKNGEYLHDDKVFFYVANRGATFPPEYCTYHKVSYEDYLQRESLQIEEDETPSGFVEEVVLFVANLSLQTTKILHIIDFFKDVGEVVHVRPIVDQEGKHVGYGFDVFASANEAKRALEKKNGEYLHDHKILLMKGSPDFVEAVAVRNKTLFVARLSRQTEISHVIDFFKDDGEIGGFCGKNITFSDDD